VIGLEKEMGAARIGDCLSADDDLDMALARQRIDALKGIPRMLEDLFVFFHPLVHLGPFEGKVIF
jgi:hypothetical protein